MYERLMTEPERVLGFDPQLGATVVFVAGLVVVIFGFFTFLAWLDFRRQRGAHQDRVREFVQRQYRDRAAAEAQLWDRR